MHNIKIASFLLILALFQRYSFFVINVPGLESNKSAVVQKESLILAAIKPTKARTTTTAKKPESTTSPPQSETTYDWGQWTSTGAPGASETTYDWGQHTGSGSTFNWGQYTSTGAPGASETTYDWGQHTGSGSTFDWGQYTSTGAPGASRTTYDWGQHTGSGSTYDWGQHTGSGSTYDWGQHTGSGSTYDWGQHTPTNNPDNNSTENPNEGNEYRCAAGKYTCKGTIGLCISLTQICDGKQDCPHLDDEDKRVCFPGFGGSNIKKKNYNSFAGTGFMFRIKNLVIQEGSDAKLFNQNSDNRRVQENSRTH